MAGPFQLYLIRHGIAEERGEDWPDDTKRPLTDQGKTSLKHEGRGLVRLGVVFDTMLTSPLVRAKQTAEIIANEYNDRPQLATIDSLSPNGTFQSVLNDLEKYSRKSRIALVGHEPDLGELAARLAGFRRPLQFKKGAICRIDVKSLPPAGPGSLRWFFTPKILRAIRK